MAVPEISAIVVNYRRPDILGACLHSLETALDGTGEEWELIVVDNASGDESCDLVRREMPNAKLLEMPDNLGFPTAVSRGTEASTGSWVLLINNDVKVEPDAVAHMLAAARSGPRVGSVAAQMRFANDPETINSAGIGVDRLGIAFDRLLGEPVAASETQPTEVFGACGGAALYRREMLDEIGGFDETFFFALDDADVSWRAQMKGWKCLYAPGAVVMHHHGATIGHGSSLKYFHVGLNRIRTLAKNADSGQLLRHGPAMVGYDIAYVTYAAVTDRTLAPLRGRLKGVREWRSYRRSGAPTRGPVELAPTRGLRAALGRRSAWQGVSSALHTNGGSPERVSVQRPEGGSAQ
jgi:GT2 family glycosyltransferase